MIQNFFNNSSNLIEGVKNPFAKSVIGLLAGLACSMLIFVGIKQLKADAYQMATQENYEVRVVTLKEGRGCSKKQIKHNSSVKDSNPLRGAVARLGEEITTAGKDFLKKNLSDFRRYIQQIWISEPIQKEGSDKCTKKTKCIKSSKRSVALKDLKMNSGMV